METKDRKYLLIYRDSNGCIRVDFNRKGDFTVKSGIFTEPDSRLFEGMLEGAAGDESLSDQLREGMRQMYDFLTEGD